MAQDPSVSVHSSNGTEYRFILAGGPNDGLNTVFILTLFAFVIITSLIVGIAGFVQGNMAQGFLGLALLILPFIGIALSTKVTRS